MTAPGQTLVRHVATDAPRFRVAFHRWRDGFVPMDVSDWLDGQHADDGTPDADWHWPPYPFDVPRHWPSGVYVAHLIESGAPRVPLHPALDRAAALFVVRGAGRAPILYKLPLATWHAY